VGPPREFNTPATATPRPIESEPATSRVPVPSVPPAAEPQQKFDALPTLQIPNEEIPSQSGTTVRSPALKVEVIRPPARGDDLDAAFPEMGEDQADQKSPNQFPNTKSGAPQIPAPAEPEVDDLPVITPRGTFVPSPRRQQPTGAPSETTRPDEGETNPFTRPKLDDNPFEQPDEPSVPAATEPDENPFEVAPEAKGSEPLDPSDNKPAVRDTNADEPTRSENPFNDLKNPVESPKVETPPASSVKPDQVLPDAENVIEQDIEPPAAPGIESTPADAPRVDDKAFSDPDGSHGEAQKGTRTENIGLPLLPAAKEGSAPETTSKKAPRSDDLPPLPGLEQPEPQRIAQPQHRSRQEKMALIQSRAGQAGMQGFCPVVLRDDRELQDAKPEFSSSFDSKSYHFSSLEAKQKFDAHPQRYAPAAAGHDVVLLAEETEDVEGSLMHAAWFRDRLYLFSSAVTKARFVARPTEYVVE
jgi:YHS domain-containing protein